MITQEEVFEVEFGWNWKPTHEQQLKLAPFVREGKELEVDDDGTLKWPCRDFHMTIAEACRIGQEFTVKKSLKVGRLQPPEGIESILNRTPSPPPVNERCNVIVAGNGLMEITHVEAFTNYCSDSLQSRLREGWCILAICVQPDQRRPDYILGRK